MLGAVVTASSMAVGSRCPWAVPTVKSYPDVHHYNNRRYHEAIRNLTPAVAGTRKEPTTDHPILTLDAHPKSYLTCSTDAPDPLFQIDLIRINKSDDGHFTLTRSWTHL
jgi:hypothetical protein